MFSRTPANLRKVGQFKQAARAFDSKFEGDVLQGLLERGLEVIKNVVGKAGHFLAYRDKPRKYYPDFILPNGVLLETKGMFDLEDRNKMLAVREHHPDADIRILFTNPKGKINKGSKTTYADWCDKHGFKWAKGPAVPEEWLT